MYYEKYPTQEELIKIFSYKDGNLFRKQCFFKNKIGSVAGSKKDKYCKIRINNTMFKTHVLIYIYHHGSIDKHNTIDHINRDKKDNRIENLRSVNIFIQSQNRASSARNRKSIYQGVVWRKDRNVWTSSIGAFGKRHYIGYFKDELECAIARDRYIIENKLFHPLNGVL